MREHRAGGAAPAAPEAGEYEPGWWDASISLVRANLLAVALIPLLGALVLAPYALLWGIPGLTAGPDGATFAYTSPVESTVTFISLLFAAIVVHEALHGVGFALIGKIPRAKIGFGIKWLTFTPYCHCAEPMPANAYRWAVALPTLALGVLPGLLGILTGSFLLAFWAVIMLVSGSGDLAVLWAIRKVPGDAIVRDHPARAGCLVRAESAGTG
jgi:hypothetical protein